MLDRLFRRHDPRTRLATAGLLVGLIISNADWFLTNTQDKQPDDNPVTPTSAGKGRTDFLEWELKVLVTDLGVPAPNIPDDFVEKVRRWARLYQTRDRDEMERVLGPRRMEFEVVCRQVANAQLLPEVAFLTLVESHFRAGTISRDGNAGLWQFTRDTARRNGLKVNAEVDERLDPRKSTEAACRYLLRLRRQLGRESPLMLVLAAYNMGPGRLKQRTKQVADPSNRRDFWHLYRSRVLPALSRSHLARLMAAILIGRHPQHVGFKTTTPGNLEPASSAEVPVSALVPCL
jgi:membrane-bound lytic murein transglycosylase D